MSAWVATITFLLLPASPQEMSVFILPLEAKSGVTQDIADVITDRLVADVRETKVFARLVSPTEVTRVMSLEQQQALRACVSDQCAVVDNEVAGALGVTHIIVGNLARLGESYLINLKLLELRRAIMVADVSHRAKGVTEEALLDVMKPALVELLWKARLLSGAPAAPSSAPGEAASPVNRPLLLGGLALVPVSVATLALAALLAGGAAFFFLPTGTFLTKGRVHRDQAYLVRAYVSGAFLVAGLAPAIIAPVSLAVALVLMGAAAVM